ncbi:MAG: LptF/LptG family permease [Campylobacterales bacterium]|nr:LptF/LptG family permease [Campylobacterales bacterium]
MSKITSYLSANFSKSFFTIITPFFIIVSLVYFVRISILTSKIQMSFTELVTLYLYFMPSILFYTIPFSFVAALAITLTRQSQDNELPALYSLGIKSSQIMRYFLVLSILFSVLLLSLSFFAMPALKQEYKTFLAQKKAEAKLNISSGSLGQKFGDYYIFVDDKNGTKLNEVVIYNKKKEGDEQIFAAKSGEVKQDEMPYSLVLHDGYGYTYDKEKLMQVNYKNLRVFDNAKIGNYTLESIIEYWKKASQLNAILEDALFFLFVSLIPLSSLYLVAAFTMIHSRYETNVSFLVIFVVTLIYYSLASIIKENGSLTLTLFLSLLLGLTGRYIFQKKVVRFF